MSPRMHLILVGVILVVTFVALVASGQIHFGKPGSEAEAAEDMAMLVTVSATWGENCNDYIASMSGANTYNHQAGALSPIKRDNVLRRVSTICDAKKACAFPINAEMLGPDPAPGCTKALTMDYRCSETGVTTRITAYTGSELSIDCRPATASGNQ